MSKFNIGILLAVLFAGLTPPALAQPPKSKSPVRGSIVEDRAARKLLEAGDSRFQSDETKKAVEIWQSVIERYPRSRVLFQAHMRLGNFYLERDRAYDRARVHFAAIASESNTDSKQRAEGTLKMGVCFYQARNFGKSFRLMREVIEKYPVSSQVNEAYYYIGLGHFQLGHYSRAISALEKVGTTLAGSDDGRVEKVEAGKRLFVKIEDADLSALQKGEFVSVLCKTASGDEEIVKCFPVGRNVRLVLGTLPTRLGSPVKNNGRLEVRGDDKVTMTYVDRHTADKKFDRPIIRTISVVGDGVATITDGAFGETLKGVVLGKSINIQLNDADRDLSDKAETIQAIVEVYRRKTDEELEEETAKSPAGSDDAPKIDPLKLVDRLKISLKEVKIESRVQGGEEPKIQPTKVSPKTVEPKNSQPKINPKPETGTSAEAGIHTGVFRTVVLLGKSETANMTDGKLQALPGDIVRVVYLDERHSGKGPKTVRTEARCIEGNLGGVRVTKSVITDQELRIKTRLKTASALTNIGNRYKEFGLKKNAGAKYKQALGVCDEIMKDARQLRGSLLEQTYVQLWKIYFEMDNLNLAAAMAQRLQRDFPNSGFVDDALLQLADVARKQKNLQRAIGIYARLVNMKTSQLRGEAQFGIAQCYEQMALAAPEQQSTQLADRAFQEFKKVFENFPDSGRVGEAVAKMANHYYKQKDYTRAVEIFDTVLSDHPDAKYLDVILFNYGRCLYRMNRKRSARQRFDQLIQDFPESPLAGDAKKISDALAKPGS
jgi:TolA-binding protein